MIRTIPTIGGTSGLFEVFVPGIFVLLNIIGAIYYFPLQTESAKNNIIQLLENPALSIIIIICFGYLLGVILRIFRAQMPDQWSASYHRLINKKYRGNIRRENLLMCQNFPYIGWLGVICQDSLPKEIQEFYYNYWAYYKITNHLIEISFSEDPSEPKIPSQIVNKLEKIKDQEYKTKDEFIEALNSTSNSDDISNYLDQIIKHACLYSRPGGRRFFNLCKTILISCDDKVSSDISARTSLNRYISSMSYALIFTIIIIGATLIQLLLKNNPIEFSIIIIMFVIYLIAFIIILHNYRFMRLSEAQTLFFATFNKQNELKKLFSKILSNENTYISS